MIDGWCYLGAALTEDEVESLLENGRPRSERDTYWILVKHEGLMAGSQVIVKL